MTLTDDILSSLVAVARDAYFAERAAGVPAIRPLPGDTIQSWDVRPLRLPWSASGEPIRWTDRTFGRVPSPVHTLVAAMLRAP